MTPDAGIDLITMTEANARGVARLAREAAAGHPVAITRHKRPVAVIIGFAEYQEWAAGSRGRPSLISPPQG